MRALAQAGPVRLPLHEFVADPARLISLRKGVAAMKALKPSDPMSWFYQAAIHGVTDQLICGAAQKDPAVWNVNRDKYWNQCPHEGENSANFLPWHRGYTYHFEQILRMHTGDPNFALPYWEYSRPDQRDFPRQYGIEHLDGNTANNSPANINPLFHPERDYYVCGYEHPFTDQLPLASLNDRAVDDSRVMASPVFFGTTEAEGVGGGIADTLGSTRGLLEQSPHDHVHRLVGGNVQGIDDNGNPSFAMGGMAVPPTAGFDPIFSVHHANMDRLWAKWACLPGKDWGALPNAQWFDEKPWFFFDTSGQEVNRPRRDYFDHRALGIRFKDDDPACTPLALPAVIPAAASHVFLKQSFSTTQSVVSSEAISASLTQPTRIPLASIDPAAPASERQKFTQFFANPQLVAEPVVLTLHEVEIGSTGATGFDAFLVKSGTSADGLRRGDRRYLGQISLFNHPAQGVLSIDQAFELGTALQALNSTSLAGLELLLVPYALTTPIKVPSVLPPVKTVRLNASGFTITRGSRPHLSTQPQHH